MIVLVNRKIGRAAHGGRFTRRAAHSDNVVSQVILRVRCRYPIQSRPIDTTAATADIRKT